MLRHHLMIVGLVVGTTLACPDRTTSRDAGAAPIDARVVDDAARQPDSASHDTLVSAVDGQVPADALTDAPGTVDTASIEDSGQPELPEGCATCGSTGSVATDGGLTLVLWCGECPECAGWRQELSAAFDQVAACSPGDACALKEWAFSIPCWFVHRVGADLSTLEELGPIVFGIQCQAPGTDWSCAEPPEPETLACVDGVCRAAP